MSCKYIGPVVSGKQRGMSPIAVFIISNGKYVGFADIPNAEDKDDDGTYEE